MGRRSSTQEGSGRALQAAGGDQGARPSRAGQAARPVFHPGTGGRGADLLASQGRDRCARRWKTGCAKNVSVAVTIWCSRRTSCGASCGRSADTKATTRENMYPPMELDDAEYRLKPMNCPGHILIYKNSPRSYRDLPLRLCGAGQRLPLRALGHHARAAARARLYAGRCAHLLHAEPDGGRGGRAASTSPRRC